MDENITVRHTPGARDYALAYVIETLRTPRVYFWYIAVVVVYLLFYRWHSMLDQTEGWLAVDTLIGILFIVALVYPVRELVGYARDSAKLWNDERPTLHFSSEEIQITSRWRTTKLIPESILSVHDRKYYFVIVFKTGTGVYLFKRYLHKDGEDRLRQFFKDLQATPRTPPPLPTK